LNRKEITANPSAERPLPILRPRLIRFGNPLPPPPSGRAALRAQKWRLIEKGLITREEFMQKISEKRATYLKLLNCFSLFSLRGLKLFGEALYFFFELAQFGSARTLFLL
jgi:hypothetical protein